MAIKISIAGLGWWGKVMIERLSRSNKLEIVNLIDPFPDQEALKLAKTNNLEIYKDFDTALNSKTFEANTLYGTKRKDFMFYSDFAENKNAKVYNQFELAGYFHLYKYDSKKLCKRTHDAGWVDAEFKEQFKYNYVFSESIVSHLGCGGMNWKGKSSETFIYDDSETSLKKYAEEFDINFENLDSEQIKKKLQI